MSKKAQDARPRRQLDPGRRDRLIDVAIDVIADRGAAGASHRAVAEAAGVPLGATTYYFASLDELHLEAMGRHARNALESYRAHLEGVTDRDEVLDALTGLIEELVEDRKSLLIAIELYAIATRKPELLKIADKWIELTTELFGTYMDLESARTVNALTEGMTLHGVLTGRVVSREAVREQLARLVH